MFPKKFLIILILLLAIFSSGILFFLGKMENKTYGQVCLKEKCFEVELAMTEEQRARGLMFRENLGENKGMLFIFDKADIYPFWMKNTLVPLDIIWLDKNKKVVFVQKNCQPCLREICPVFEPSAKAKYVLEIKGGMADKIGLALDEQMEIR